MFSALRTSVATKHVPALAAGASTSPYSEARKGNLDPRSGT